MRVLLLLALCALLLPATARADNYDYMLKWSSLTAAKNDPMVQKYLDQMTNLFDNGDVVPDMTVWRASQDTIVNGRIVHTPLAGWFMMISLPELRPALANYSATQLVLNRDACGTGLQGCVVATQVSKALLLDIRFQPVLEGSNYPFGRLQ